jgi:hypothetical protein
LTERQEWAEPLPDDCPPEYAWEPENEVYYRLVDDPANPRAGDFVSNWELQPHRRTKFSSECIARGLSIHDDIAKCREMKKWPLLKDKQAAAVTLPPECGVVAQTGKDRSHYTWWLKAAFDPVSICEPV